MLYPISWQLLRSGGRQDKITLEAGVDDLDDDVFVGESNDQTVFRCVTE
jgi:hypothetical protein